MPAERVGPIALDMGNTLNEPWVAPVPPKDGEEHLDLDPRVITNHQIGALPCPSNPPPPQGWRYWHLHEHVPPALAALTLKMLNDSKTYPMGTFMQTRCADELVAARVEWHDFQGATGKVGCFRGVNLLRQIDTLNA